MGCLKLNIENPALLRVLNGGKSAKPKSRERSYWFGYNGMEKDPEMKGDGNSYTTEFRQYDPRLGRWLSLDPLMMKYPSMSPYVAFNNNPIIYKDPLGLEGEEGDPPVGTTCYDENDNHLKYEGNGEWSDVVTELDEFVVKATTDFSINGKKPNIDSDHGHLQDYYTPEGFKYYDFQGTRKPTMGEQMKESVWNAKAFLGTLNPTWGNCIPLYKHFQDATGTDYEIDFEDYFDDDESATILLQNATSIAKKSAQKLIESSGSIEMTSIVYSVTMGDQRFPYPETVDWHRTLGSFNFYMTAIVTVSEYGGVLSYSMELTIHAEDRYNFNPGMSDISTGIPDNANGIFEITQLAKEFNVYGSYTTTVTWEK